MNTNTRNKENVIPPAAFWMPLSKGTHREPHGRLIPPAKYQYTSQIYDIGTEILYETCFGHNSTQNERKSMIFSGIFTEFSVHCESAIKTRFQALFKNRHPWIRGYRFRKKYTSDKH